MFGDPVLWAKSTLKPKKSMELTKIYDLKCNPGGITGLCYIPQEIIRHRMWLHDILDDNNIPYYIEFITELSGRRRVKRKELHNIYVEKKYAPKVRWLIKEFKKPATDEELYDGKTTYNMKDGITQIPCPFCKKEIDFDNSKCPFCKLKMN